MKNKTPSPVKISLIRAATVVSLGSIVVCGLAAARSARAAGAKRRPTATDSKDGEAKALHKQAVKAALDGNYVKATELWKKAYQIGEEPKFLYNLARMSEEMDRPAAALRYFRQFLDEAPENKEYAGLAERAESHVANLQKRVAKLSIVCHQRGARLSLDGDPLGTAPLRRTVTVNPGKHVVAAKLAKHHAQTLTAKVKSGQNRRLQIRLRPIKKEIIKEKTKIVYLMPRWLPWTILGAGLAVGGISAYPYVRADEYYDKYDETADEPALKRKAEDYEAAGIAVLTVGSVIAAAGALTLILNLTLTEEVKVTETDERAEGPRTAPSTEAAIVPLVLPGGAGLTACGRF